MHVFPSSQLKGVPWQVPLLHVSPVVHAEPSSHVPPLVGAFLQPVAGSQESAVHGFPSSQLTGVPWQVPLLHVSSVVHAEPSSHDPLVGTCWHPVTGSHESAVQGFPSSQLTGVPWQVPPLQTSPVVQAEPSSHAPAFIGL